MRLNDKRNFLIIFSILSISCWSVNSRQVFTKEELIKYNGQDPNLPIYLAVKGFVFDVSSSPNFYGKNGAYGAFAGRDCTKAVAKWSTDEENFTSNLDDLTSAELKALDHIFETLYKKKYPIVGVMDYNANGEL